MNKLLIVAGISFAIISCGKESANEDLKKSRPPCIEHLFNMRFLRSDTFSNNINTYPAEKEDRLYIIEPGRIPRHYFKEMGGKSSCFYRFYKAIRAISETPEVCARLKEFEKKHGIHLRIFYRSEVTFFHEKPADWTLFGFSAQLMPFTDEDTEVNEVNAHKLYGNTFMLRWPLKRDKNGKRYQDCSDMRLLTPEMFYAGLKQLEPEIIEAKKRQMELYGDPELEKSLLQKTGRFIWKHLR